MSDSIPILSAKCICKNFGRNEVLRSVDFDIEPGEIHALIGENGAGKSTLLKILFGVHKQSSGSITVDGSDVSFESPMDAKANGIAMIHQEPLAFQEMSILENLFIGHIQHKKNVFLDFKTMEAEAEKILQQLGLSFPVNQKMQGISVAEQQLIEIGAALVSDAKVIFMDEPTASLTPDEVNNLLAIIRSLKEQGKSIVYISHRLEEIKQISDRITILRDGCLIGTFESKDLNQNDMIQMMIGCEICELITKEKAEISAEPYFEVKNISIPGLFENISFDVRKGEIFGIAGLMGSGRTEVARAIFGITPVSKGEIWKNGQKIDVSNPGKAIENGIALVPEDRQGLGLFLDKSIAFNTTFSIPTKISGLFGWINKKREKEYAEKYVKLLRTKASSVNQPVGDLSGGNQQKVSLAKWISIDPDVLILDEPTRGIDVGAKTEVYKIINQLVQAGKCVIMISSELCEVLGLSDRVMVMYEGRQTLIIDRSELSEMKVLSAAHDFDVSN